MELLIATTNPAKFSETEAVLKENGLKTYGLQDFPEIKKVEETGETFEENAVIKARGYFAQIGVPCLADDGGLIVDYLGGLPGVHSHRWLGHEADDQELAEAILKKLEGVPVEKRTARLGGVTLFYDGVHTASAENYV